METKGRGVPRMEELLGRAPVELDTGLAEGWFAGKTVLITGGGGSIGSELCRQVLRRRPARLVIADIYENNAYDIQQELLLGGLGGTQLDVEIASVRDRARMDALFAGCRPQVVFHAAAHKHVPLMERCAAEAIRNNVFGTCNVIGAAQAAGAEKLVLISTDKAVNPTSVMGATKRLCELVLQSRRPGPTQLCAVRFGNVLGSNGSVVPLFWRQIAAGGPVTITDRRIIRYFMTVSEAAQLVLEAAVMAQDRQIFVLDMGEPVHIAALAERLIRLAGLEPGRDIEIREVGLRPGEKLYEELLIADRRLRETANRRIFVEQPGTVCAGEIDAALGKLRRALDDGASNEALIALLHRLVPDYREPDEVNALYDDGIL